METDDSCLVERGRPGPSLRREGLVPEGPGAPSLILVVCLKEKQQNKWLNKWIRFSF